VSTPAKTLDAAGANGKSIQANFKSRGDGVESSLGLCDGVDLRLSFQGKLPMVNGALDEGFVDGGTAVGPCCTGFLSKGFLSTGFHGGFPEEGFGVSGFLSSGVFLSDVGFAEGDF
jgi:hypothetical protein